MMSMPGRIFLWLALAFAFSLPVATFGRKVALSIVHTTDLHGYILPTTDYDGNDDLGGFLRCAARIEAIRQDVPNMVLIDCGDTFQGSPESYETRGRLVIDGLNRLRYDAWILGNHEFDWGTEALRGLNEQAEVPLLAANARFPSGAESWLPGLKPYVVRDLDGVRVVVVGLVTPGITRWSLPNLVQGMLFDRSVETLQALMPEIHALKPDVLIVAVHQGFKYQGDDFANEIRAIASAFPEIDVLLGGHTHLPVEDMRINGVLYSQAGYHGIWLGRVDLVYDTVAGKVIEKAGTLELMTGDIPYHEGLLAAWKPDLDRVERTLSRPLGFNPARLTTRPNLMGVSPVQQLIARAIAAAVDTDFVLHGSLNEAPLEAGPLTYRDVWQVVPYENTIGVAHLTAAEIREILQENYQRRMSAFSLGPYGFTFDVERVGDEMQVGTLRDVEGNPLHARKRYRVAMNSFVLASGGARYPRTRALVEKPEARLRMLDIDTRSAVARLMATEFRSKPAP